MPRSFGRSWVNLHMTHEHLDRAIANYELAEQKAMTSEVHNIRATAFFAEGREQDAVDSLKESLAVSLAYGVRPQATLARRLLGEALVQTGNYKDALEYLNQAQTDFSDMGMFMDLAATLVALGTCHALMSENEKAQNEFEQALGLSEGILPEIEWQAQVGLGGLAELRADTAQALKCYRQAVSAFSRIRKNFWQPSLAGAYLQKPSHIFDNIITFVSRTDALEDTLSFIERFKASTLLGQLLSSDPLKRNTTSQELMDMEAEILFLQEQLRTSPDQPFPFRARSEFRQIRTRLIEKTQQFEKTKARLERQTAQGHLSEDVTDHHFDESVFRALANKTLQGDWIALDYYLAGDELVTVIMDSNAFEVISTALPHRFRMALDACKRAKQNAEPPSQSDLDALGKHLIPARWSIALRPIPA